MAELTPLERMLQEKQAQAAIRESMQGAAVAPTALVVDREFLIRVCKLEQSGMQVGNIARALGRFPQEIVAIQEAPEYRELYAELASEQATLDISIDKLWDNAEMSALRSITSNLASVDDPEYALKVARLANQAKKRLGTPLSQQAAALNASRNGVVHVTLNLSAGYVTKKLVNITAESLVTQQIAQRTIEGIPIQQSDGSELKQKIDAVAPPVFVEQILETEQARTPMQRLEAMGASMMNFVESDGSELIADSPLESLKQSLLAAAEKRMQQDQRIKRG